MAKRDKDTPLPPFTLEEREEAAAEAAEKEAEGVGSRDWTKIIGAAAAALIAILTAVNTFVGTWNNRKIADVQEQQNVVQSQTKAVAAKVGAE